MLGQHNWARWHLDPAVVYLELDAGEGPREVVGARGGAGNSWGAFEGAAAPEPALWVCSKIVAFNTFRGIISSHKSQPRRWELPSDEHALPASLLPSPPEAGSRPRARGVPGVPLPCPHSASSSSRGQVPG